MTRYIQFEDMADLATGAAILGTGGGGDPYRGRLMAELAIKAHGPVRLIDPADDGRGTDHAVCCSPR